MRRPQPPTIELNDLREHIVSLNSENDGILEDVLWEPLYNKLCAAMNRNDMLKEYIAVLCELANVRPDQLDELLELRNKHAKYQEVLQGKGI